VRKGSQITAECFCRLTKNNNGGWGLYVLFDSGNTKLKAKVNNVPHKAI
jgi:hypothetical protein